MYPKAFNLHRTLDSDGATHGPDLFLLHCGRQAAISDVQACIAEVPAGCTACRARRCPGLRLSVFREFSASRMVVVAVTSSKSSTLG